MVLKQASKPFFYGGLALDVTDLSTQYLYFNSNNMAHIGFFLLFYGFILIRMALFAVVYDSCCFCIYTVYSVDHSSTAVIYNMYL